MGKKVTAYKEDSLDNLQPNSIVALRVPGVNTFELYVTDLQGVPYALKKTIGEVDTIKNTDGTLDIIGGLDKIINLNPEFAELIYSAIDKVNASPEDGGFIKLDTNGKIDSQYIPDGAGDKTFQFTQSVVSDNWTIEHNLDKFPSVTVTDSAKSVVEGSIKYINKNKLEITFSSPFSGYVQLN